MMVKIAISLAENEALGLPLQPLVWSLAFGACLGGKSYFGCRVFSIADKISFFFFINQGTEHLLVRQLMLYAPVLPNSMDIVLHLLNTSSKCEFKNM